MKISEVLANIREFTDYMTELGEDIETHGGQAQTHWDYILGVHGPTPVLYVCGSKGRIFDPLQAVTAGWEECHDFTIHIRPSEAEVTEALQMSERNFKLINAAVCLHGSWNKQLRVDLIAACGMDDERQSNWFKETYEKHYAKRNRT